MSESASMGELNCRYPPCDPYDSGFLDVSPRHRIYYEQSGQASGKPAIVLHGGPGAGSSPTMRRHHDPSVYRIVLFDQRGCGRSTPTADLEDNDTWALVADMERLRVHLGIDAWQVFGGSWGSTLALAYAQKHPERVTELVLRGIFMLRRREISWFYQEGAGMLFPEAWADYLAPIPPAERGDMVAAYYARLTGEDEAVRLRAAQAWSAWEASTLTVRPDPGRVEAFKRASFALPFARIECHYFVHGGFFERDDQLSAGAPRLAGIPTAIIQGRYDVVTPAATAWALSQAMPHADFQMVEGAGHAASEPGIIRALRRATDGFRG